MASFPSSCSTYLSRHPLPVPSLCRTPNPASHIRRNVACCRLSLTIFLGGQSRMRRRRDLHPRRRSRSRGSPLLQTWMSLGLSRLRIVWRTRRGALTVKDRAVLRPRRLPCRRQKKGTSWQATRWVVLILHFLCQLKSSLGSSSL